MSGWLPWLPVLLVAAVALGFIMGAEWQRTRRSRRHARPIRTADRILAQDALERAMGRAEAQHRSDEGGAR